MVKIATDVVLITTGFQLLVLASVLLAKTGFSSLRHNLLAAFLLTKAGLVIRWFSFRFDIVEYAQHHGLYLISCAGFFFLAPLLYLFVQALCYRDFRLRWSSLIHAAPAAAFTLFAFTANAIAYSGIRVGPVRFDEFVVNHYWDIFWTCNLLQILVYIIAIGFEVIRYRRQLADSFSSVRRFNLQWLIALLLVLALHWTFVVFRSVVSLLDLGWTDVTALVDLFSITIFLVFTTILVIKAMVHTQLFPGIAESRKPADSPLSQAELHNLSHQLAHIMQSEEPHLRPELCIDDLATALSIPVWQLSRVINSVHRQNFFNFVNSRRVQVAQDLLSNPANNQKTILHILHASGFNSKSTFNDAFKRHAGMTPSQYRKQSQDRHSEVDSASGYAAV